MLLPGVALAHASFDVAQVPADSTQEVVLRVPLEREAVNDLVEVLVPGAFAVDDCGGADGWTCAQDETTDGDTVVTFERAPDGPGDTERFALTLTAPAEEGVYVFPTIQTYDDGEEAAWIGEPGSDQPAPRIQVGDETAEVERSEDATPHTDLASEAPSAAPTADPTTATSATDGDAPTPGPTASASEEGAGAEQDDVDAGGPSLAVLLIGAALLAAFAVAVVVARSRN